MSSDVAIRVTNLSKCYEIYETPRDRLKQFLFPRLKSIIGREPNNYFRQFWALKELSFEVMRGETVAIIGRNGSGKSTLLQMICGTITPTNGTVETFGQVAALLELGAGFNPEFSGRENVYMNASILGLSKDQVDEKFDEIAAFADIGDFIEQPVKTYSSGMYIRLAFAVQACVKPQILIVDEALSVGDEKFQRKCFDYIERLRSAGCAIAIVTHSTATVEKFCQRAVLLHNGDLHGYGPSSEIIDQYHALLYSDEKTYLRYVNKQNRSLEGDLFSTVRSDIATGVGDSASGTADSSGLRAIIKCWEIVDEKGCYAEAFKPGEIAIVRLIVDVFSFVKEIQAGLLIRTIEGVTAFGTSSLYHGKNYYDAHPDTTIVFEFNLEVALCAGTYFVTLSIAEALSQSDMAYIDRKTDVIVIKVLQPNVTATGIAALKSSVTVSMVNE